MFKSCSSLYSLCTNHSSDVQLAGLPPYFGASLTFSLLFRSFSFIMQSLLSIFKLFSMVESFVESLFHADI